MRQVRARELDLEAFQAYGTYGRMIDPKGERIGSPPAEFFRDMVQVDLGSSASASMSVCRVERRPLVIESLEYHDVCGEGVLPLDGDVLIHVAPATPPGEIPLERIEVFRVPRGTLVSIKPGVWHHAPFALDEEAVNVLVVLPERTYALDCEVHQIPKKDQIEIKV